MANIKVNPSKLESTAKEIDIKVNSIKNKMNNANNQVSYLSSSWSGKDYNQFKHQWDTVTNQTSVYTNMIKGLESYSSYLKYVSNRYKNAKTNAINRANKLPRW